MVIKRSPGGESAGGGRAVNFEIHLCGRGMISDCIWRSISIQNVQIEAGVNSDLGDGSFWVKLRDAKYVHHSRSTQVKIYTGLIASTDVRPQEMFTFFEMLALVESESSSGAYVRRKRPVGLHRD